MNKIIRNGLVLAASAAALFAAGCAAEGTSVGSGSTSHGMHGTSCKGTLSCRGTSSCKGQSSCKSVSNSDTDSFASSDNKNDADLASNENKDEGSA